MNVVVSYKQKDIIDNANIDAIKDLNGFFNVDDLIDKFKNYFFSKMILDATSIENFATREVLTKLVNGIGADRLIILLPETPLPPDEFKKLLIDLKIYNFSNNIDDVVKFIDNPNTYETAMAQFNDGKISDGYVDNSISNNIDMDNQQNSNEFNDMDVESSDYSNDFDNQTNDFGNNSFNNQSTYNSSASLNDILSSFNVPNANEGYNNVSVNEQQMDIQNSDLNSFNSMANSVEQNNDMEFNNINVQRIDNMPNQDNSSYEYDNVASNNIDINKVDKQENSTNVENNSHVFLNIDEFSKLNNQENSEKKVIGFKNITMHAGSTSLIYMLLKTVVETLKKDALAIEINKNDFKLFINKRMVSVTENEVSNYISTRQENIIFVDLNDCKDTSFCDDVIYLLEPSVIMLNRLMIENLEIFKTMSDKKVVLNKSLLTQNDIRTLSSEAGINFLFNIEPVNDRINNDVIVKFLNILDIK